MTTVVALWLPILVSAVFVFIASSIIHMAPLWHKNEYPRLPNEDAVGDALRPLAIPPGDYVMPRPASGKDMRSPEFLEKMERGPVLIMTVIPSGKPSMARNMVLWFIYCVVMSIFAAYITSRAVPIGTSYLHVFRFIGATAFLGYAAALWQMSIWFWRSWSNTIKSTVDGLLYALLTAGVFGWLWPR